MNVLVRASTVLIDAPYLLNLECKHYINNSKTLKEIVLYNGLEKDRWSSSFGSRDQIKEFHVIEPALHVDTRYLVHLLIKK